MSLLIVLLLRMLLAIFAVVGVIECIYLKNCSNKPHCDRLTHQQSDTGHDDDGGDDDGDGVGDDDEDDDSVGC